MFTPAEIGLGYVYEICDSIAAMISKTHDGTRIDSAPVPVNLGHRLAHAVARS